MSKQIDDLLAYLFDGQPNPASQQMATWLASSRRFAAFATAFRDKIRKKVRTAQDQNTLLDLQLELETAYLLLREPAFNLAYEPEQSRGRRSPDFAVTFTTSLTFMVEVTRVQADLENIAGGIGEQSPAATPRMTLAVPGVVPRLADVVGSKLGQLLSQRGNIILVAIETRLTPGEIRNAMLTMQQRAERNDALLLRGHGFLDRADFFRHYKRLTEVLVRVPRSRGEKSVISWINPQAKHPLPSKVHTVLNRSLSS